jgi:hypothetical protein
MVVMGVSIVVVCKGNIAMLGRAQQGVSGRWGAVGEKQKPPSEVLGGKIILWKFAMAAS